MTDGSEKPKLVDDILARIDSLPTISHVALRVGELVNDPRSGAREIAEVMRQDPSLSAKVLRLVNSSYYGIPGGVSDVARAISFIGFSTLHQLVLSVSVLRTLRGKGGVAIDVRGLWLHSLAVGACAEVIAKRIGHSDPRACFTAGLLHDLGKIALATAEGERFAQALEGAKRAGVPMHQAEREAGLPPHDRVGSRLARKWRFPAPLLVAIEHHHSPANPQLRRELAPQLLASVDIIALADDLSRSFAIGDGGSPPAELDADALERLNLTQLQVGAVRDELMRKLESSKIFLELLEER